MIFILSLIVWVGWCRQPWSTYKPRLSEKESNFVTADEPSELFKSFGKIGTIVDPELSRSLKRKKKQSRRQPKKGFPFKKLQIKAGKKTNRRTSERKSSSRSKRWECRYYGSFFDEFCNVDKRKRERILQQKPLL